MKIIYVNTLEYKLDTETMDECEKCMKNNAKDYENSSHQRYRKDNHRIYCHPRLVKVLLVLLVLSSIPLTLANSICRHHEYWDSNLDECVPCTKCNRHQIVIRPCQRHLDTICRPINSVDIDWNKSLIIATDKTIAKKEHHRIMSTMESLSASDDDASRDKEMLLWDWQLITLILAITACFLFFAVTAIISINYVRQWRKIKKQFDTDIEQLSQQLMSRLAVPPTESSTIFIDDPTTRNSRFGARQIELERNH
ncbi:tumor necrosis factor receptor superfamily member wengen-like isoform X2 [Chironomus tepperi]|uniref:tumor necrosis factor receptor superfamily member wengen-like isoform X2 n=1 Tax=Chironomus tepperi TaxID=113505 RepID=UPI00391F5B9F